jgi:AcrR family transcriptional regulator
MSIPNPSEWSDLDPAEKRERLLRAAGEVFACEGIEAPMPSVAAAAGAGIGSVYRQFPSKEDLLAALVLRRFETVLGEIEATIAGGEEPWPALVALLWHLADRQANDDVLAEAMATVSDHPEVASWALRCEQSIEKLMAAAREQGSLRGDAAPSDVRLLLAAVRSLRRQEADGWRRILQLGIDGLARSA